MKRYDATAPSIQPAPSLLRRTAEGVVGGALLGLLFVAGALLFMAGASWWWFVPICLAALSPLLLAARSNAEILRDMIERVTQRDIDRDGYVGAPPEKVYLSPYLGQANAAQEQANIDWQHEVEFIRALGGGTSWARWVDGGLISREDYTRYRDDLLRQGWARWIKPGNTKSGWKLMTTPERTAAGLRRHSPAPDDAA